MATATALKRISVKELAKKVINHEDLFILDTRNTGDFDDWKIEGRNIEVINSPYVELLEGVDSILHKLPKSKEIYVICAKGGASEFVAEQIIEEGFTDVYSVEGGMNSWSEYRNL